MAGLSLSLGEWEEYANEGAKSLKISRSAFIQQCLKFHSDSKKIRKIQVWLLYVILGLLLTLQIIMVFLFKAG